MPASCTTISSCAADSSANAVRVFERGILPFPKAYLGYSWGQGSCFGRTGDRPGEFRGIGGVDFVGPAALCVAESVNRRVQLLTVAGEPLQILNMPHAGLLRACCSDAAGRVWVLDDSSEEVDGARHARMHVITTRIALGWSSP